jgi:hypothetical protein
MRLRASSLRFIRRFVLGLIGLLPVLSVTASALAQADAPAPLVPAHAFYVGLGGGYNSVSFGTQNVYMAGTSDAYVNGYLIQSGAAAGPADISMNAQSTFAPAVQGGYFQHFGASDWLWGAKFAYAYLGTTSTVSPALVPQSGSYTYTHSGITLPLSGNVVVSSYQAILNHQFSLLPFVGYSFDRSYVYFGVGPTLSQMQTKLNRVIGFADIKGQPTDISGSAVDFASSGWVVGGAFAVGGTYFLNSSWFLDASYSFAMTRSLNGSYFSPFTNTSASPVSTVQGTLSGTSSGNAITQGVTISINKAF